MRIVSITSQFPRCHFRAFHWKRIALQEKQRGNSINSALCNDDSLITNVAFEFLILNADRNFFSFKCTLNLDSVDLDLSPNTCILNPYYWVWILNFGCWISTLDFESYKRHFEFVQVYLLAQETIVLLLEFNPDSQALLDWVIDRCYTASDAIADGCFNAMTTVFSNRWVGVGAPTCSTTPATPKFSQWKKPQNQCFVRVVNYPLESTPTAG